MYCFINHDAFHMPNCGLDLDWGREHMGIPDPPLLSCVGRPDSVRAVPGLKCENPGRRWHFRAPCTCTCESILANDVERKWTFSSRDLVNAEQPISIWLVGLGVAEDEVHLIRWGANYFYLITTTTIFWIRMTRICSKSLISFQINEEMLPLHGKMAES